MANRPIDVYKFIDTKDGDTNQCWPWTGSTGQFGRPTWRMDGKYASPTRIVYSLVKGEIADGLVVRHTCDNAKCCNHTHLELGTRSENEADKYLRDRAGLPVLVVREIRRLLTTTNQSDQKIADYVALKFDHPVSREAVRNIKLGKTRTHGNEKTQDELIAEMMNKEN
jgi:hypothetical protein